MNEVESQELLDKAYQSNTGDYGAMHAVLPEKAGELIDNAQELFDAIKNYLKINR